MSRPPEWDDFPQPQPHAKTGQFDRRLGRVRTPSDDFFDHRKQVSERITAALAAEKKGKRR